MEDLNNVNQEFNFLSEHDKSDDKFLIRMTDQAIQDLVKEKSAVQKAYNYYDGQLDKDQFLHIEEVYGISSPTSVEFIPLVRPHIDQLVGELLQIPFKPKVTCKDKKTLSNINRDKQLAVAKGLYEETKKHVNNVFISQIMSDDPQSQVPGNVTGDPLSLKKLEQLKEELVQGFISEYEIGVQYLIEFFKQNRTLDLLNKRKEIFKDLLISGQCYYDTNLDTEGSLPMLERIHPLDCFVERNFNSPYLNKSSRAVIRRRLTKHEILLRYGSKLKGVDLEKLQNFISPNLTKQDYYINSGDSGIIAGISPTILGDPTLDNLGNIYRDRYLVYEIQFLAANTYGEDGEKKYRIDRYRTIKIGEEIYILLGKDENVFRSLDSPNDCTLSINGICYEDSKGQPYSLMLATAHLQDKYNILYYHRDNIIALSGVKGSAIETSIIPDWLGDTPEERFKKLIAYKKAGVVPLDSQQEGQTTLNTALFQPYDDSLSGEALTAIQLAITQTEEVCSRITGVFRERLGGIEQKDAVSNVQVGIRQSAIITKQYYQIIDLITKEILNDLINFSKLSFKNGFLGSIVLGDNLSKIFEIKPDQFNYTDYDIHLDDSGDIVRDMQKIEQLTLELIKAGQADVDVILSTVGTYSLTQMRFEVQKSIDKKKKEMDQINQLTAQLEQQAQQAKELQSQMQKLQVENDRLKMKDRELEKYRIDKALEGTKYTADSQKIVKQAENKIDEKRVELEQMQLFDNNPYNNEIQNT